MNHELLLAVVLIFQIHVISIWLPIGLVKSHKLQLSTIAGSGVNRSFNRRYLITNALAAGFGIFVLNYVLGLDANAEMTRILMAIGACFLVQVAPLAMARSAGLISDGSLRDVVKLSRPADQVNLRLTHYVPSALTVTALFLLFMFLSIAFGQWDGHWNSHLLKIMVFLFSHVFLTALLFYRFRSLRNTPGAQYQVAAQGFSREAPVLVAISIGLSLYFLGKEFLFLRDLHEFRPAMMSLFLQMLAMMAYSGMRIVRQDQG